MASRPGASGDGAARRPQVAEVAAHRRGFQPNSRPTAISASSAPVLAVVKTFWMSLPQSRPRVFVHVSSATSRMPSSCTVESETA